MERDVLWLLEEAGEENLATILATLNCSQEELSRAVTGLRRLGFVSESFGVTLPAIWLTDLGRQALAR